MDDKIEFEIELPSDDDGYTLLQCEHCGTFFKCCPSDIKDEGVLDIFCPSCGLISGNYLTDDVIQLAEKMEENYVNKSIYAMFKGLEKQTKQSPVRFDAGRKPDIEDEEPIRSGIEALSFTDFPCCNKTAKIKPLLQMTGCYCPYCGVKNYEFD